MFVERIGRLLTVDSHYIILDLSQIIEVGVLQPVNLRKKLGNDTSTIMKK